MTTATFLVTLNIEDTSMIPQYAADIDDDLAESGYDVVEVKPWARPSLGIAPEEAPIFGGMEPPPPSLF
jgi:hypothetical protein